MSECYLSVGKTNHQETDEALDKPSTLSPAQSPVPITVITSTNPKCLTKHIQLVNGELEKSGGGILFLGRSEITVVDGLDGFKK